MEATELSLDTAHELNIATIHLQNIIIKANEWNKEFTKLMKKVRQLFNRVKSRGFWEDDRRAFTKYNKELRIRRSKTRSWTQICEGIKELVLAQWIVKKTKRRMCQQPQRNYQFSGLQNLWRTAKCSAIRSIAGWIYTTQKINWAVENIKPFKTPGWIFVVLLSHRLEIIVS